MSGPLIDIEQVQPVKSKIASTQDIEDFLAHFERDGKKVYREQIELMMAEGTKSLVIDVADVVQFNIDMARDLLINPTKALGQFKAAAKNTMSLVNPVYAKDYAAGLEVRLVNTGEIVPIRDVGVALLGKIFSMAGVVIRVSERKNIATEAAFRDPHGHVTYVTQTDENLKAPEACEMNSCNDRSFEFDREDSTFSDYQRIRVQELGDDLPPGQLPRGLDVVMLDDLIDSVRPGDHVVITGALRPVHEKTPGGSKSRVFTSEIECNSVEVRDKEEESAQLTKEDESKILAIANQPDAYEQLTASIAPAIIGYQNIKETVLLQLAGGVAMSFPDGTRRRGDIHCMIVGDPGVAKSEILQFASKVALRGVLATGKGSSAVGLSAGIVKQGDMSFLEVGVLPLADQGFAVIDELDKMRADDRSALHEGMEQQTITINKAGFHMTLNTRASILAALNPIGGVYDKNESLMTNIKLPPSLVSRFDLVTILIDRPSEKTDTAIAKHILSEHEKGGYETQPPISMVMLRKYIAYVRLHSRPKLTASASKVLEDYYIALRRATEPGTIPVTARALESLIRLATARAKILLKKEVTAEDATVAIDLMARMLSEVLTDPNTNKIDTGVLAGVSTKAIGQQMAANKVLRELAGTNKDQIIDRGDLKSGLIKQGLEEDIAERMVGQLDRGGRIYEVGPGKFKIVPGTI